MTTTYIIVGENEKITFHPTSNPDVQGFVFTPISRCVGLFAINKQGECLVSHIDPFTDLNSVKEMFVDQEITKVKMIYNPRAGYSNDRREEVESCLGKIFNNLEKIELTTDTESKESITSLITLGGDVTDREITIDDDSVDIGGSKHSIIPPYSGFSRINSISESIQSTICYHNKTRKSLRQVGTLNTAFELDIYETLQTRHATKEFAVRVSRSRIGENPTELDWLDNDESEFKRCLGEILKTIQGNEAFFNSWQEWIEQNSERLKTNSAMEPLSEIRKILEEDLRERRLKYHEQEEKKKKYLENQIARAGSHEQHNINQLKGLYECEEQEILTKIQEDFESESLSEIKSKCNKEIGEAQDGGFEEPERETIVLKYIESLEKAKIPNPNSKTKVSKVSQIQDGSFKSGGVNLG